MLSQTRGMICYATYEAFDIGLSEIPSVSAIRFEALCTEIQILAVNQVIGTSKK